MVELKVLHNLNNEAIWAKIWVILQLNRISRLVRYGKLS